MDMIPDILIFSKVWLLDTSLYLFILWVIIRFGIVPIYKQFQMRSSRKNCPSILLPPLLQAWDKTRTVTSDRKDKISYRINLYRLTCSCHRFRNRRRYYPKNDIRRLCRHLRKEYIRSNTIVQLDGWIQAIIEARVKDHCYVCADNQGSTMAIGFQPDGHFVRVYTQRKLEVDPTQGPFTGPYDKFTFLLNQEVWVYGDEPPGSDEIILKINTLLPNYSKNFASKESLQSSA